MSNKPYFFYDVFWDEYCIATHIKLARRYFAISIDENSKVIEKARR